jgi:hypothetical protein
MVMSQDTAAAAGEAVATVEIVVEADAATMAAAAATGHDTRRPMCTQQA